MDSVALKLDRENSPACDYLALIHSVCDKPVESYSNGVTYLRGNYKNMRLSTNGCWLKIEGSLNKFLFGHNLKNMNQEYVKSALEKLEKVLGLSLARAEVKRLDFGVNVFLSHPVRMYKSCLSSHSFLERCETVNGVSYLSKAARKNQTKAISIYDKLKEVRKPIPVELQGMNMLRYEFRILKTLAKELRQPSVYAYDLFGDKVWSSVVRRAIYEFSRIQINPRWRYLPSKNATQFKEAIIAEALLHFGEPYFLDNIKSWQSSKQINRKEVYRLKCCLKTVKKKIAANSPLDENDLGVELKQKIMKELKNSL